MGNAIKHIFDPENEKPGSTSGTPHQTAPQLPPQLNPPVFNKPNFYAPRQSQLQRAQYNPTSTSHNYLQRYGIPSHD